MAHPFGDDAIVEARFGSRTGWVIIEPRLARELLRRRELSKGRSEMSRAAVGGYPSQDGPAFHRRRSEVVLALARASADVSAMRAILAASLGNTLPPRAERPAAFTHWMLLDLTRSHPAALELNLLRSGIDAAERMAEAAQGVRSVTPSDSDARATLERTLAGCVAGASSPFVEELRTRGWSNDEIVDELIGLALAGWESTAAAVTSALTIGLTSRPSEVEIEELLRLYPPSWLIVRTMTGGEDWGSSGDLAVVSPWLTQRSPAWHEAERFDPERTHRQPPPPAAMPFGTGQRRCPAGLYARIQIAVALNAFGGAAPRPGKPALVGHRSATLLPDDEEGRP
jgi:cytochrome P450